MCIQTKCEPSQTFCVCVTVQPERGRLKGQGVVIWEKNAPTFSLSVELAHLVTMVDCLKSRGQCGATLVDHETSRSNFDAR